jgi:multiple sugar transport system substrate-binding protein
MAGRRLVRSPALVKRHGAQEGGSAMSDGRTTDITLSRRAALRLLGGLGATTLLAACGSNATPTTATSASSSTSSSSASSSTATSAASSAGSTTTAAGGASTTAMTTAAASSKAATTSTGSSTASATKATGGTPAAGAAGTPAIELPNLGIKLPTQKLNFHWVQSGPGPKTDFFKPYFAAYQQAHNNITIQLDELPWPEIGKVVPLGIQGGNAPDVFQIPQNVTAGQVVQEGWVQPLDDIMPNFQQWKAAFPPGSFLDGVHVFNGKTYTFPFVTGQRYGTLLLYNRQHVQQAGLDFQAKFLTWDDYRAAAQKFTQQGAGKYYGVIIEGAQTANWGTDVSNLAEMAGAAGGEFNWKTGQYNYASDQFLAAIELLLALKAGGSVFPGSLSLNAQQARSRFTTGVAGMMLQGPWNIATWAKTVPDFDFDVTSQPVPNSGTPLPLSYGPAGGFVWVYAKSKYPEVAADLIYYIGTEQGQAAYAARSGGAELMVFAQANQVAGLDPRVLHVNDLFAKQMRLGPSPNVRNPDIEQVDLETKAVTPDFGTTVQGIVTGQLGDPKAAMQGLQDRMTKERERAVKAAQAKGAKVSLDDYKFPNWDSTKDYTQADYDALKH